MMTRSGSQFLREACRHLGCTQAQMAGKLEISDRTFRRYVSGKYQVPKGIEYAVRWLLLLETGTGLPEQETAHEALS